MAARGAHDWRTQLSVDEPESGRSSVYVPRTNLKDLVVGYIREQILSGQLKPSLKIDQDVIAETCGVSRLPVREALIQLAEEGLVFLIPRRGAFVASLQPEDFQDHYRIYGLVSGIAAERAASRLSAHDLRDLREIRDAMRATNDAGRLESLNIAFHRIINRAGASGRLMSVLRSLANSLPSEFYAHSEGWADLARTHHEEILEALESGDSERARDATVQHLELGGNFAVQNLRRRGFWSDVKQ